MKIFDKLRAWRTARKTRASEIAHSDFFQTLHKLRDMGMKQAVFAPNAYVTIEQVEFFHDAGMRGGAVKTGISPADLPLGSALDDSSDYRDHEQGERDLQNEEKEGNMPGETEHVPGILYPAFSKLFAQSQPGFGTNTQNTQVAYMI